MWKGLRSKKNPINLQIIISRRIANDELNSSIFFLEIVTEIERRRAGPNMKKLINMALGQNDMTISEANAKSGKTKHDIKIIPELAIIRALCKPINSISALCNFSSIILNSS